MWLFDKLLLARVSELEKHNETLIGANSILERELEKTQFREKVLQDRLFELSGISHQRQTSPVGPAQPSINLNKKSSNWPDVKANLELKAREAYWNKKKIEAEHNNGNGDSHIDLDKLEKEVLGD